MSYDNEQKSILAGQHKRMAMGVPITGQTMNGSKTESKTESKPKGGLSQVKSKK